MALDIAKKCPNCGKTDNIVVNYLYGEPYCHCLDCDHSAPLDYFVDEGE